MARTVNSESAASAARNRLRLRLWLAAVSAAVVSVGLAARFSPEGPRVAPPSGEMVTAGNGIALASGAPQWQFVKLGAAAAPVERWTDPVPARIAVDQARASKVGVPLGGHVTRVFVELGQRVGAGDPLFSVASPDIAELQAAREHAGVDLEAARTTLSRVRAIVATRALPAKEEVTAQQQLRQAEVAFHLAESKLASLRVRSRADSEFTVSSPRPGVVVEKNVLVDQQVTPDGSGALMVIADLSSVWVVAELFEGDAADIREGAAAQVTSPSLPDVSLQGKVEMVSAVVDPGRHTLPVRVRLPNPERLLRPNVYATVRFATPARKEAVEVPASALVSDGEHQYVYVQDAAGHFTRREVAAGSAREGRVPVVSGLTVGETIVEEGAFLLDNQLALDQ
jgi:cobalt-zinc-cadmium efflux system membrane fusion protein